MPNNLDMGGFGAVGGPLYPLSVPGFVTQLFAQGVQRNVSIGAPGGFKGYLSAQTPDGTVRQGNLRGENSVDWSTASRYASAAKVASGQYAVIGGGINNTASSIGATVAGGQGNAASGGSSTVSGGINCSASGNDSSVGGGQSCAATASQSTCAGGYGNAASGVQSFIGGGYFNTASGTSSWIPGGRQATTRGLFAAGAFGMSQRAAAGDRQNMWLPIACAARTDATPTVLTSDAGAASATNQMVLPNNSTAYFEVDVIAHDASLKSASWKVQGTIRRGANAAATTIVGANVTTPFGSDLSGGSPGVTCTADTTNGALAVTFTGIAATTIYPSGLIRIWQGA